MKFNLSTSRTFYENKEQMQTLTQLGFTFEPYKDTYSSEDQFEIAGDPVIEINTIHELMDLFEKVGEVIIHGDWIEIYNDYRE